MHASIILQVDFTDEWYAVETDFDDYDAIVNALLDIDGVTEVCLDHCCWVRVKVDAEGLSTAQKTIDRVQGEIARVIQKFSK